MDLQLINQLTRELLELERVQGDKERELRAAMALQGGSSNGTGALQLSLPRPRPPKKSSSDFVIHPSTGTEVPCEVGRGAPGGGRRARKRRKTDDLEWLYTGQLYVQGAKALSLGKLERHEKGEKTLRVVWLVEPELVKVREWAIEETRERWPRAEREARKLLAETDNGA